jgi:hypothetical protein
VCAEVIFRVRRQIVHQAEFCHFGRETTREKRWHHHWYGRGAVAAPAWLLAPDWRDLDRRREIEEGMNFTKMHKKLKS